MAKIVRHCPHCDNGDTYEFDCAPPVDITCEDCGSRLKPLPAVSDEREGWLEARDYHEAYEDEYA